MSGYVVSVDFRLKPEAVAAFRKLIGDNARASVRDEPGCRQFDVVTVEKDPTRVVLYEVYDDAAAFEAHKRTPHFAVFDRESAPLVASKDVVLGELHVAARKT